MNNMKKVRESNFELLRCILMFMVVLVHYNNADMGKALAYVTPGTLNYYFVYFVESLSIIGTNGFVLLTGYFSWKKETVSLRKPIGLLIYVSAYGVLFYLIKLLFFSEPFSIRNFVMNMVPRNWYIILYIVLTLISPAINTIIKDMGGAKACIITSSYVSGFFSMANSFRYCKCSIWTQHGRIKYNFKYRFG